MFTSDAAYFFFPNANVAPPNGVAAPWPESDGEIANGRGERTRLTRD
jgi:hypothetical protein